jgi:adenosylmethionine-8-amino-7-oxononanoate aminotransferase
VFVSGTVAAALESDATYRLNTGYTYSGHATACAAALKNLEIIQREGLVARATVIGERLGSGLRSLADDGVIGGVRGVGGMWGAAMKPGQDAAELRLRAFDEGVIVRAIGDHTLTFCPPLVISDQQIDRIVDTVATVAAT